MKLFLLKWPILFDEYIKEYKLDLSNTLILFRVPDH